MISYECGIADVPLSSDTIGGALRQRVAASGGRLALVSRHQGLRLTWSDLAERSVVVARGLLALGVEPGDRVGIWAPTRVEWTDLQFGTAMVGAILVNINPAYRAGELSYAVSKSGVRIVAAVAGFRDADYFGMLQETRERCPSLERVVAIGTDETRTGGDSDLTWAEMLEMAAGVSAGEVEARERKCGADDPINIQFTSGTTGSPKGATLTHRNVLNNGAIVGRQLGYTEDDAVCIPVPLYHCFGMGLGNLGCLATGATMIYPAEAFDPIDTLGAIAEERCTSIYGVPTMFIAMLSHPRFHEFDLTSLRTGIMAGAPCPIEIMRRVVDEMHASDMTIAYGMTETSPASTMTRIDDSLEVRTSTIGSALPHTEIKIADLTTLDPVVRGEKGEICTRGYLVMPGYWDDADATREAIVDGWMRTGDLGTMDAAGNVNVVGRLKDMVIRGGENIYPREIEEIIFTHPSVESVQVVGVPDERFGEELAAFVISVPGAELSAEEICDFCRRRLARFKVPRYVLAVDEFPMTVTGKIQKFVLRQQAVTALGLEAADTIATA
ncbi:MAG TPA: AMP-binding protein [Acidimicrobiales bacterium]|jgi:fatty-acyl-CoA synthase|nr:AMP-binding protein [Acidimicrobiales bacterium]